MTFILYSYLVKLHNIILINCTVIGNNGVWYTQRYVVVKLNQRKRRCILIGFRFPSKLFELINYCLTLQFEYFYDNILILHFEHDKKLCLCVDA